MELLEKYLPSHLIRPRAQLSSHQKALILKHDCKFTHKNACSVAVIERMIRMTKNTTKVYALVHILSTLIFKRKELMKMPLKTLKKLFKKIFVSVGILVLYGFCTKMALCYVPKWSMKIDTFTALCFCISGGSVIVFESPSRTKMMTMVLLSRWIESMTVFLGKRRLTLDIPKFWHLLFGLSWGILSTVYYNDNGMAKTYKRIFDYLLGEDKEDFKKLH